MVLVVWVLALVSTWGDERGRPEAFGGRVAVVAGAEAVAEHQADRARGLVADLTLGHAGALLDSQSAKVLPPGRYRLHALVGSTPHDHILSEAVGLRLSAGDAEALFQRHQHFPRAGELMPVHVDVVHAEAGPLVVKAGWLVSDANLDRQRYRNRGEARRMYEAQRQDAINQYLLQQSRRGGAGMADAGLGIEELLEEDTAGELRPQPLDSAALPAYRLMLAGLVIEQLSPISISDLRTDRPAYPPGASAKASVTLTNHASEPVEAVLQWSVASEYASPRQEAIGEAIRLDAGESREHPLPESFTTAGVEVIGKLRLSAGVGALRPVTASRPFVMLRPPRAEYAKEKEIFAHYMACWPIGYGALPWEQENQGKHLKHESNDPANRRGGHVRNWALRPQGVRLTPEESAELEIRRAMRIGIDGFAIDAWAGGESAMETFSTLIRTAEAQDLPFKLTLCIDPATGGKIVDTVRWLLDTHGESPKLARRDGRPLIFGYFSAGTAWGFAARQLGEGFQADSMAMRRSPLAWHLAGAAFSDARWRLGENIFYHFDYTAMRHPYHHLLSDAEVVPIIGAIAHYVDAVGAFGGPGSAAEATAEAVRAAGAEWSGGVGMYMKENIPFEVYAPPGLEWFHGQWEGLRHQDATLPQLITWNDYGEYSNIAPGWDTRYSLYDLTGYQIAWWKSGKPPAVEHDRLYLIYAKYPRDAEVWPFAKGANRPKKLEVLTILTAPATVRLPGREIEFEAPAGYSRRQFPLSVGPVIAEIVRDGETVERIESPEPITDRPFRESNGFVCYSTEFMRHWQADFGDAEPFLYAEYADADDDGLPNWFEMYWFTKERDFQPVRGSDVVDMLEQGAEHAVTRWLDFSTMTAVDPDADPNGDGKSNLESYRERIDPTRPAPPAAIGDGLP